MTATPNAAAAAEHTPVMLRELLEALAPRDGAIYVDGTFGAGGTSGALLDAADCRVWGIDRDPDAVARGKAMAERYAGRLEVVEGRFGDMDRLIEQRGAAPVDGVTLDLGVSSPQLDQAERGFSFRADGPLDMRMEGPGRAAGPSAAEVINSLPETELADVIYRYGEERKSRPIARAIVAARRERPLSRTLELAEIVRRVVKRGADNQDPATRTFQALRIYVNDELGELDRGLSAAERLLAPGGRLAVIAFHSLEDRRVKAFLQARSGAAPRGSRHLPEVPDAQRPAPTFQPIFKGARRPGEAECAANPRARSARLRAAERTAAPASRRTIEGDPS
jgi:16S rRNA (cytosine1402-N4)-methyltransferase